MDGTSDYWKFYKSDDMLILKGENIVTRGKECLLSTRVYLMTERPKIALVQENGL